VFLPITVCVLGICGSVEAFGRYREKRRERLHEQGRKLTVEQAYALAARLGLVYYSKGKIHFRERAFYDISYRSNKKKEALLYGWKQENWANYDSPKPDGARKISSYITKLEARTGAKVSIKKVACSIRTRVVSYVPATYWALVIGGATFIWAMSIGFGWGEGEIGGGIGFGFILMLMWLVAGIFLYCGGEESNGWISTVVDRYGEPLDDDIFISYLKAVKKKMCPLIEWTD